MGKRGQQVMGMSFGMIFSIILIVVFIVVAFIAVKFFLDIGERSSVGLFYDELQDAVDNAWGGQSSQSVFEVTLPSGISKICFANLSSPITGSREDYRLIRHFEFYDANTFLIPPGKAEGMEFKLIKHIDIEKITEDSNPYCVSVKDDLKIKKDFYDKLVLIE